MCEIIFLISINFHGILKKKFTLIDLKIEQHLRRSHSNDSDEQNGYDQSANRYHSKFLRIFDQWTKLVSHINEQSSNTAYTVKICSHFCCCWRNFFCIDLHTHTSVQFHCGIFSAFVRNNKHAVQYAHTHLVGINKYFHPYMLHTLGYIVAATEFCLINSVQIENFYSTKFLFKRASIPWEFFCSIECIAKTV